MYLCLLVKEWERCLRCVKSNQQVMILLDQKKTLPNETLDDKQSLLL